MGQIWNENYERLSQFVFKMWPFTIRDVLKNSKIKASKIMDYVQVIIWVHQP